MGEVVDFYTRQPFSEERRDQALTLELAEIEAQLPAAQNALDAAYNDVEYLERRREDIKRAIGLLGVEHGLGDGA